MSVEQTLARLESLNKQALEHNRKEQEIRGSKKARVQAILKEVEILNSLGYPIKMELASETEFTKESIESYKALASKILAEKVAEAERLEKFFEAVEKKDYDAIKEITGEDVSAVSYDVEVADSKEVKAEAKEMTAQMLENDAVVDIAKGDSPLIPEPTKEIKFEETVPTKEEQAVSPTTSETPTSVETTQVEAPSNTDTSAVDLLSGVFGSATPTETVEVEVPKVEETPKSTPSADTNPFAGFDTASWEQGFKLD
jgi:hypothetical protein